MRRRILISLAVCCVVTTSIVVFSITLSGVVAGTAYNGDHPEGSVSDAQVCRVDRSDGCTVETAQCGPVSCGPGIVNTTTEVTTCYTTPSCAVYFAVPEEVNETDYSVNIVLLMVALCIAFQICTVVSERCCCTCPADDFTKSLIKALLAASLLFASLALCGVSSYILSKAVSDRDEQAAWRARSLQSCTVLTHPVNSMGSISSDFAFFDVQTSKDNVTLCDLIRYGSEQRSEPFVVGESYPCYVKADCGGTMSVEAAERDDTTAVLGASVAIVFCMIVCCVATFCLACGGFFGDYLDDHEAEISDDFFYPHEPAHEPTVAPEYETWELRSIDDDLPVPPHMVCPISLHIMTDPVSCSCRELTHTFERVCLERSLNKRSECPLSRHFMTHREIKANTTLQHEINAYLAEYKAKKLLEGDLRRGMHEPHGDDCETEPDISFDESIGGSGEMTGNSTDDGS